MVFMIRRAECAAKGIHRVLVAGISGSATQGAQSICVSSAYEDDKDNGDTLYAYVPLAPKINNSFSSSSLYMARTYTGTGNFSLVGS